MDTLSSIATTITNKASPSAKPLQKVANRMRRLYAEMIQCLPVEGTVDVSAEKLTFSKTTFGDDSFK